MERRALLAAALSVLVIVVWQYFFAPPIPLQPAVEGSGVSSAPESATSTPLNQGSQLSTAPELSPASSNPAESPALTAEESIPEVEVPIEGALYDAVFSSTGGGIRDWVLTKYTTYHAGKGPLAFFSGLFKPRVEEEATPVNMNLFGEGIGAGLPFSFGSYLDEIAPFEVDSKGEHSVVFVRRDQDLRVVKRYDFEPEEYLVELNVEIQNIGSRSISGEPVLSVIGSHPDKSTSRYAPISNPAYLLDGSRTLMDKGDLEDGPVRVKGTIGWAGVNDKYFLRAVIPVSNSRGEITVEQENEGEFRVAMASEAVDLRPGQSLNAKYEIYLGPKQSDVLKKYNRDLEQSLDFGMFGVFAEPLLWLLKTLYGLTSSYGLAIILLTLIIKTLFYPLMVKQLESAQRMKEFQPQMNALKEKYKDDKNRLNQEMMKFMQENKVNPLGGCLPMLLQMPIWFALYKVLLDSIELYHTPFLYFPDLSSQDPYGISPLILGALMFVQQKMTPQAPGMDPMQAKMMQYLPLIFAAIMFSLPSGLVVYILVNTLLTIVQQRYIALKSERKNQMVANPARRR